MAARPPRDHRRRSARRRHPRGTCDRAGPRSRALRQARWRDLGAGRGAADRAGGRPGRDRGGLRPSAPTVPPMDWGGRDGSRWLEGGLPGAAAAFSTRIGGGSEPPYEALNVAILTGDDREIVKENRRRLTTAL